MVATHSKSERIAFALKEIDNPKEGVDTAIQLLEERLDNLGKTADMLYGVRKAVVSNNFPPETNENPAWDDIEAINLQVLKNFAAKSAQTATENLDAQSDNLSQEQSFLSNIKALLETSVAKNV